MASVGVFSSGWVPVHMGPSRQLTVGRTIFSPRVPYTPTRRYSPARVRHSHGMKHWLSSPSRQLTLTVPAVKTAVRSRAAHCGEKRNRTGTACTIPVVRSSFWATVMAAPVT